MIRCSTDQEIALCEFPMLPQRESQRTSSVHTQATRPRTFRELRSWENFLTDARNFTMGLTNEPHLSVPQMVHPQIVVRFGLPMASCEIDVQAKLTEVLFPFVNDIARNIGMNFRYASAGSGRSCSQTDIVIFDRSMNQNMDDLSERVYGVGEVKGTWQWEITNEPYAEQILNVQKQDMLLNVAQQVFGDMVIDEAIVGFISNYNQTIFFYRDDAESKSLFFSPLVDIKDAPVEKFLYVLHIAENQRNIKSKLSRNMVEMTSIEEGVVVDASPGTRRRQQLIVTSESKGNRCDASTSGTHGANHHFYSEYDVDDIPVYEFDAIGFTGGVVGFGKYGNIFVGEISGQKAAIKTFDACKRSAVLSFVSEQTAYVELQALQGVCIPVLLLIGRLPHTSMVYLALSNEKDGSNVNDLICNNISGEACRKAIIEALAKIHGERVLHGDVTLSNMLWNHGKPYFIDFEYSHVQVGDEQWFEEEMGDLRKLLEKTLNN